MTDDDVIGALRAALATAEAEAIDATARAGRYSRALAVLEHDEGTYTLAQAPLTINVSVKDADEAPTRAELHGRANGARGGRPVVVDYAEVARIARDARGRGDGAKSAVAAFYGITMSAAGQRIIKARNHGEDVGQPLAPGSNAGRPKVTPSVPKSETDPIVRGTPPDQPIDIGRTTIPVQPLDDDDDVEPLTWGANGHLPARSRPDLEDTPPTKTLRRL